MDSYDRKVPPKCITYLDLCGCVMSQYLSIGSFRWLTEIEINEIDLAKYEEHSKKGLILEYNLEYTKEIHDIH